MMRFVGLPGSPWSERAQWALDHHRLPYEYTAYIPILGEPALRLLARRPFGAIAPPALRGRAQTVLESFNIALHAERSGGGPRLVPDIEAVIRWNKLSDRMITAGEVIARRQIAASDRALLEAMPQGMPGSVSQALLPAARKRAHAVAGRDGLTARMADVAETALRGALEELRRGLGESGHLIGAKFTYGDIAMATALHVIQPVSDARLPLGPATRECFTVPKLAQEFEELLNWRDGIYERHRYLSDS